jgi:molybdopterin-guanine dinucleotide biosynthesis adapter protein
MNICGFAGYSGAGKTTLVESIVTELRLRGFSASVIKHAHESFDVDKPGKDSHRHREAGAYEVMLVSKQRMAILREWELEAEPRIQDIVGEMSPVDWLLVEGFKAASIPKLEVWREANNKPIIYPNDPYVIAIVSEANKALPEPTERAQLDINDPVQVVDYMLANATRFEYME